MIRFLVVSLLISLGVKAGDVKKIRVDSLDSICHGGKEKTEIQVFSNGKCVEARSLPECMNEEVNQRTTDTELLVESSKFCSNGEGIYRSAGSRRGCEAQALLCFQQKALVLQCYEGSFIAPNLECSKNSRRCSEDSRLPIRDFLVDAHCRSPASYSKSKGEETCQKWGVNCAKAEFVRCPAGNHFDSSIQKCSASHRRECEAQFSGCRKFRGYEWSTFAKGECSKEFVYCEGSTPKIYHCDEGQVFHDGVCVPPVTAGCPICTLGDKRASDKCNRYFKCEQKNDMIAWQLKQCKSGMAFNAVKEICQRDYSCAQNAQCNHGTSVKLSCDRFLYCVGGIYEERRCPMGLSFGTSGDCQLGSCHNNTEIRSCLEGEVSPSVDCKSFGICEDGKFKYESCSADLPACARCYKKERGYGLEIPAECSEGETKPNTNDCTTFFACSDSHWEMMGCKSSEVFDSATGRCIHRIHTWQCTSWQETGCKQGERIENSNDCSRLLECVKGRWEEMQCPSGTIYDKNFQGCKPGTCDSNKMTGVLAPSTTEQVSDNMKIHGNVNGPPAPPTSYEDFVSPSCSAPMRIRDEFDCSRFWQCDKNRRFVAMVLSEPNASSLQQCPPRSHYDESVKKCVPGTCNLRECSQGEFQPKEICGEFRFCRQGRFVDGVCSGGTQFLNGRCIREKCNQVSYEEMKRMECVSGQVKPGSDKYSYQVCYYGKIEDRKCSNGQIFDWESFGCIDEHISYSQPTPQCYNNQRKPADSCQTYQVCENGSWKTAICPYGQQFHEKSGNCVAGNCYSQEKSCKESGGPDGYRRVPQDCSKYYQCVHGSWMERPCAPGTYWNPRISTCDHKGNVPECGIY